MMPTRFFAVISVVLAAAAPSPAADLGLGSEGNAYYYYSLAQQERFQRNYLDAVSHLKSAVEFDPHSVALRLELAKLYWLLGNRVNGFERNAIAQGEEAVRLAPDDLETQRFLASVYTTLSARGRSEDDTLSKAILHQERALILGQDDEETNEGRLSLAKLYMQAGRAPDAVKTLKEYLVRAPDSVEALFWLSRAYGENGQLDEAVVPLQRALDLSPRSFNLSEALVELQRERQDLPAALEAAHRLVELAPDSVASYMQLAALYRASRQPLEALDLYDRAEQAMASGSDDASDVAVADLELERVQTLVEADRGDEAMTRLDAAANRFPEDRRFPLVRGQLRYRLGDTDGGLRTLRQLLEDHPGDEAVKQAVSSAALGLGDLEHNGGHLESCESLLEWAIEIDPENHQALNYLGYLWADQGTNLDRSVRYIQRALRIGGENGAYLDSLGWAYFRQARYDLAEQNLVRAAALSGNEPEILGHLGDLYKATGRESEAVEFWRRALDAGAPDRESLQAKIDAASGAEPPR